MNSPLLKAYSNEVRIGERLVNFTRCARIGHFFAAKNF